jgi:hypothetical protein
MASAVSFFRIFSRQTEPQQKPEAASHSSAAKHLKTNERSDLSKSTLSEKRVVHYLNSFSAELSNFVLRILIERTFFQNTQIPYDMLIYLINDLIKVLSPEKEETINFAKECTILWKECKGQPLTDEEKKYDGALKNLDVPGEILRGLSYSFTGLLGQGLCASLKSAVGQGLWKHAPSIVGYFGLMMWGPKGVASAVNHVLQKSTLSSTQRVLLEPWLIAIGRLALGFVPKVHATEKGIHYHYPSLQGSFQTFSPGQAVTVQGDRLSIERQGNFVTAEGSFEATATADFKLQEVMELNEARIKIRVMNDKGQSVPVEFIRVQGKYGPEVQVKCDDKTLEHYWNRYFHPVAKIAPPSDATLSCATSLTLGGLGSLATSNPVLLAAGGLPCLISAQAKPIKTPDYSCQGMECSVEQKNGESLEQLTADKSDEDRFVVVHDNKGEVDPQRTPRLGVVNKKGEYWEVKVLSHPKCKIGMNSKDPCVEEMQDLESITKVQRPGFRNHFITCTSGAYENQGKRIPPTCFYLELSKMENGGYKAKLSFKFQLPTPEHEVLEQYMSKEMAQRFTDETPGTKDGVNIEAFALGPPISRGANKGKYHAVWAHRGLNKLKNDPDNKDDVNRNIYKNIYPLTWFMKGIFDLNEKTLTAEYVKPVEMLFVTQEARLRSKKCRQISDLFIANNNRDIFAIAALDGGDNGPFRGYIYQINDFLTPTKYKFRLPEKKVEAVCLDSKDDWVVGIDNEDSKEGGGGFICTKDSNQGRNCVPLKGRPKTKNYGISGIALLDS